MDRKYCAVSCALAGLVSLMPIGGCARPRISHESSGINVYAEGIDGWCSGSVHKIANDLAKETGAGIDVESVHYWERSMPNIRKAYNEKKPILLFALSAGCDQVRLTAKKCEEEGIFIDRICLFDPFYTSYSPVDIPDNVGEIRTYFSTDKLDVLFWARGDIKKIETAAKEDRRFSAPKFIRGSHWTCFFPENIMGVLKKEIDDVESRKR
ncbi:hypothetical protein J4402_02150 [Candidatus Pacearchaeota archaeon]|nr:hypothetical protein [Candidatus Pacearchaeota archaeon]